MSETQKPKRRVDPEFMAKIGAKGGKNTTSRPFRDNRELAREAGRKGGLKSRRGKANAQ